MTDRIPEQGRNIREELLVRSDSTPQIDRGSERFYSLGMKVVIGSIAGYAVGLYLMDQNSTISALLNMALQPISADLLDKANDIRKMPLHLLISGAAVVGIVCFDKVPES